MSTIEHRLTLLKYARHFLWNGKQSTGLQQRSICGAIGEACKDYTHHLPRSISEQYDKARGDLCLEITKRVTWTVRWWLYDNWLFLPVDLQCKLARDGVRPINRNTLLDEGVQAYRLAFLEELIREHERAIATGGR